MSTFLSPFDDYIYAYDIVFLRENTFIGEYISFDRVSYYGNFDERVEGVVVAKYPYTFVLDNGRVLTWQEYLVSKRYIRLEG